MFKYICSGEVQLCINNKNEDDLTILKVDQSLRDESASEDNYLRIIDDSGEDYLYPAGYFLAIELPDFDFREKRIGDQ